MQLESSNIPSYYSRLVMAKNQGHFSIARALLNIIVNAPAPDTSTPAGLKALEKINQAKGHADAVNAGNDTAAVPPAGEVEEWSGYAVQNPPVTKQLALALAQYFRQAKALEVCYEMYQKANEFEIGDTTASESAALQEAANGTLANEFGQICENAGDYAHAAEWYKKAKAAGCASANESLERMNALYGMARYYAPWIKIATATGRKGLAEAIQNIVKSDPKLATAMVEEINVAESAVPPCYEEIDYWEQEFERFAKFSDSDNAAFAGLYVAIGNILERAHIYNLALRWYKKAVVNHPTANQDAHRMLPLKSKSEPMRDAEDIYDAQSPIPSLWKSN